MVGKYTFLYCYSFLISLRSMFRLGWYLQFCLYLSKKVHVMSLSQAEINYFGCLNHPNIVKLLGYCIEKEHKMLVCEFMCGKASI